MAVALFRHEALLARQTRATGSIVLLRPFSMRLAASITAVLGAVLVCYVTTAHYTRQVVVPGVIVPSAGAIQAVSLQSGRVVRAYVTDGEAVKEGQPLFDLSAERISRVNAVDSNIDALLGIRRDLFQKELDMQTSSLNDLRGGSMRFNVIFLTAIGWSFCVSACAANFPILDVRAGTKHFVLVGSQHAGEELPGRAAIVDSLVSNSNAVCLETDSRDPATAIAGARVLINPPGKLLRDRLSAETYAAVRAHLRWVPGSGKEIDAMSPFTVSTILQMNIPELKTALLRQRLATSLDADIVAASDRHRKTILALERPDAFQDAMAQLADSEWDAYLRALLRILDCAQCAQRFGHDMATAHSQLRDFEEVTRSIRSAFASEPAAGSFYERIYFGTRNTALAQAIRNNAMVGKCSFVAVGVGHLGGPDGIVAQLRRAGLTVSAAP